MILSYTPYTTWLELIFAIGITVGVYHIIKLIRNLQWSTLFSEITQSHIRRVLDIVLLLFEPIALLILLAILVGIHPRIIGPLMMIVLLIGYHHLRNYVSRLMILIDGRLHIDSHVRSGDHGGRVKKIGRLNLELQSSKGIHVLSYLRLWSDGYTISEGDKISRLYTIYLIPSEDIRKTNHETRISDRLAESPYVDWATRPDIVYSDVQGEPIKLRLLLRDKNYLDEIASLLMSWGYEVSTR